MLTPELTRAANVTSYQLMSLSEINHPLQLWPKIMNHLGNMAPTHQKTSKLQCQGRCWDPHEFNLCLLDHQYWRWGGQPGQSCQDREDTGGDRGLKWWLREPPLQKYFNMSTTHTVTGPTDDLSVKWGWWQQEWIFACPTSCPRQHFLEEM